MGWPTCAHAWYKHGLLMPWVVRGLSEGIQQKLSAQKAPAPCPPEDQKRYQALAHDLNLNTKAILPPTSAEACVRGTKISALDVLLGPFVDDPDGGMDRDLDDSQDPKGDRDWMGGRTGAPSQGFRHQYWGGWRWTHPLQTFQVPPRSMGQARERVEIIATKAREMIRAGDWIWGMRVLSWALHYIQDLSQPFHTDQVPSLYMVPWSSALSWPPRSAFDHFYAALVHSVTNYHWAYEGYVMTRLSEGESNLFTDCILQAEKQTPVQYDLAEEPLALAQRIARRSSRLASDVGYANYAFFGSKLKTDEVSLPENRGVPQYSDLAVRPDLVQERQLLETATCVALANGAWASHRLIEWALRP